MKTTFNYRIIIIFIGGILFQYLFWEELLGLNLLLFSSFAFTITFTDKALSLDKKTHTAALLHFTIALLVSYNNTALALTTWFVTFFVFIGTVHYAQLKSTATNSVFGILQLMSGPLGIAKLFENTKLGKINLRPYAQTLKYIVAPFILVIIFCSLYAIANPTFSKYLNVGIQAVHEFFNQIFSFIFIDISFTKCLVIILGMLITAGIIVALKNTLLKETEVKADDNLARIRRDKSKNWLLHELRKLFYVNGGIRKLALKTENTVGIICFACLNILIFCLNIIDISQLWLNTNHAGTNFSAELHDGTNTLIFSIVIAMLIIVYFFSGNLNFFTKNKWIKTLVYVWIAQNAFLVASVLLRDYNYVLYHGLTHKRIGVVVFATLSLFGLASVWLKVARRKTIFFLYRVNAKVWYTLLILLSFVDWDVLIVRHNLGEIKHKAIDVKHLLSLSDKTLPILIENEALINKDISELGRDQNYTRRLHVRIENFKREHAERTWLSYSYKEAEALKAVYNYKPLLTKPD